MGVYPYSIFMTIVGFTGTSSGMTRVQWDMLAQTLVGINPSEFHHGDCIGADAQAHDIAQDLDCDIIIHPPLDPKSRAFCTGTLLLPKKDYLDRNKDIVNAAEVLVATPETMHEVLRSGTWSTVRYAKKIGCRVIIIYPDGTKKE